MSNIEKFFTDKTILVTGAVGSVGSELVRQLLNYDIKELRAVDQNESPLFYTGQEYADDKRVVTHQANITNRFEMETILEGVDYVFHTAALKHVPSCEVSPSSAIETNVNGMLSLIQSARHTGVKKMIFTSSDKAVCPTNVMGATKLLGERLLVAANKHNTAGHNPAYSITRFGNVAGSCGSVIPLFCKQIRLGKDITLTDEKMTRFMMSMQNAVSLVLESMVMSKGGEIFIAKMPVLFIADLTRVLVRLVAPVYNKDPKSIKIRILGPRHGEKFFEELNSATESVHMLENKDFLCVLPVDENLDNPYYSNFKFTPSNKVYDSQREIKLTDVEIEKFLLQDAILPEEVRAFYIK